MAHPSSSSSSSSSPPQLIVMEDPSSLSSSSRFILMADTSPSSSIQSLSFSADSEQQEQEQDQEQVQLEVPKPNVEVQRDWATLENELLSFIAGNVRHGLDYVSFRSVCTSWLSAAPPQTFPPILLLSFEPDTGRIPFFNPSDGEIHLFPYTGARGAVLAACSGSWMTLIEHGGRMSMVNPFTGDVVELPSASDELAGHSNMPYSMSGLYCVNNNGLGICKLDRVWKTFIEDVALSSDPYAEGGCIIVLMLACSNRVAFCRIGTDAAWNVLDTGLVGPVSVVSHCNGRFFVIDWNGDVVACEIPEEGPAENTTVTPVPTLQTPFGDTKLMEHHGELVMVVSSPFAHMGRSIANSVEKHGVFKSDLQGPEPRWSKVEDMGECTLFITLQCNSCYVGRNLMGCRQNSIYFSDDDPYEPLHDQPHSIKITDLASGTSSTICTSYVDSGSAKFVSWMKPSLRRPRN